MRTKTAAAILTAGLITGGGAALLAPGFAVAADPGTSSSSSSSSTDSSATDRAAARVTAIKNALTGLVSDGTINQSQADRVATTLAESGAGGPGGFGKHGGPGRGGRVSPEATAKVIGITADELRTELQAGKTLTQVAAGHDVSKAKLISGLIAAAKSELAADVTAGRLTQAQADQLSSTLTDRITERVDQTGRGFERGPQSDGPQGRGPQGDGPQSRGNGPAATPAPAATTS